MERMELGGERKGKKEKKREREKERSLSSLKKKRREKEIAEPILKFASLLLNMLMLDGWIDR